MKEYYLKRVGENELNLKLAVTGYVCFAKEIASQLIVGDCTEETIKLIKQLKEGIELIADLEDNLNFSRKQYEDELAKEQALSTDSTEVNNG